MFFISAVAGAPTWWLLAVFVTAAITDWLDGPLARKLGVADDEGSIVDGLADKIVINAVIVSLMYSGTVPAISGVTLLTRDVIVWATRLVAARYAIITSRLGGQVNMWLVFIYLLHAIVQEGIVGLTWYDYAVMASALLTGLWTVVSTAWRCKCQWATTSGKKR